MLYARTDVCASMYGLNLMCHYLDLRRYKEVVSQEHHSACVHHVPLAEERYESCQQQRKHTCATTYPTAAGGFAAETSVNNQTLLASAPWPNRRSPAAGQPHRQAMEPEVDNHWTVFRCLHAVQHGPSQHEHCHPSNGTAIRLGYCHHRHCAVLLLLVHPLCRPLSSAPISTAVPCI